MERRSHRSILPIRENEKFVGYVNVVKMAGKNDTVNENEKVECEIPDYSKRVPGDAPQRASAGGSC